MRSLSEEIDQFSSDHDRFLYRKNAAFLDVVQVIQIFGNHPVIDSGNLEVASQLSIKVFLRITLVYIELDE